MTVDAGSARAHLLQVAESDHAQRVGTAAWLDRELAFGAKVFYKGWLGDDGRLEKHWLAGPQASVRTRRALETGQLEFMDFPRLVDLVGGTAEGLHRIQAAELHGALEEGWTSVAMTQESSRRPLVDDDEVAVFAQQEGGYDELAARFPLHVLCQLTVPVENAVHVVESLGVHHRGVVDVGWVAHDEGDSWRLAGDLDAHIAQRFGGALTGALRRATAIAEEGTGASPDLHVDLTGVGFVDVAVAQVMVLAARSVPGGQHLVLHDPPRLLRRLLDALERPDAIVLGGPVTERGSA
ncbi:STAS domain-containing protein [Actinomycetospora termitidis]|uniref:STAS domain-containing protein n=1 Tax=Actinomycetospora termitidis TaxID=3053470 RepID=A0ABT7MER6_9PSEU|nr:STAS domain-containing protein [Actinomycetospora sp. Odt1-22]MDL5159159.1 STAS domain-containing protein [Actinomycetospora sp. Odt1-22]